MPRPTSRLDGAYDLMVLDMVDAFRENLGAAGLTAINENLRQLQKAVSTPTVQPATIAAALNVPPVHAAWFDQLAGAKKVERIDVAKLVGTNNLRMSVDAIIAAARPTPLPGFTAALAGIPALDGVSALLAATARPLTDGLSGLLRHHVDEAQSALFGIQRLQMGSLIRSLLGGLHLAYPPNWRGLHDLDLELIDTLLLDEGLCLAWTPPGSVVGRLFRAPSAAARREVLGRSWRSVTEHVIEQLDDLQDPALTSHQAFGMAAAQALLDGHHHAAQALATNLLDTVLRLEFEQAGYAEFTSQNENHAPRRLELDNYTLRVGLVVGGIWGSHAKYTPGTAGSEIPRRFSRHASVHAVTPRQYSRRNATVALMHATALLAALDSGDMDPD